MRIPRQSVKSIVSLQFPSLALLPASFDRPRTFRTSQTSQTKSIKSVQDGLEVVPIERRNTCTGKIFTPPSHEEKEAIQLKYVDIELASKSLPRLPSSRWSRLSLAQRIVALLCLQAVLLLTLGLTLVFVAKRNPRFHEAALQSNILMPPLPLGPFVLEAENGTGEESSSACLSSMNETLAWNCRSRKLLINFPPPQVENSKSVMVFLQHLLPVPTSTWPRRFYGPQVPDLGYIGFQANTDLSYTENGPAYRFNTTYNRTILLPRVIADPMPAFATPMEPNSSPWLCTFDETTIEVFIFPTQNSTKREKEFTSSPRDNNVTLIAEGSKLPFLPYVAKIVEKRSPGKSQARCRMMRKGSGDSIEPVDSVEPITLSESEPLEGGLPTKDCRCQWTFR